MKVLFYVLAFAAGGLGFLGLLRSVEHAMAGNGLEFSQFVIGVIGVVLALIWIKRARAVR